MDTTLNYDMWKNSLRTVLKSGKSAHRNETNFFYAATFNLIENLHPRMFRFTVLNPQAENIINGAVFTLIIATNIDEKAIDKNKRIEGFKRTILPRTLLLKYTISNLGNLLCAESETVNFVDGSGNIATDSGLYVSMMALAIFTASGFILIL